MHTATLLFALLATPPSAEGRLAPPAAPPVVAAAAHPGARSPRRAPLPWGRILKRCGAPCALWARHLLEAATSPRGFAWQVRVLARATRRAWRAGRLPAPAARRLRQGLHRLQMGLRRALADGRLAPRERLALLRGVLRVAAGLHRAQRGPAAMPPRPLGPRPSGFRTPQPAGPCPTATPGAPAPPVTIEILVPEPAPR